MYYPLRICDKPVQYKKISKLTHLLEKNMETDMEAEEMALKEKHDKIEEDLEEEYKNKRKDLESRNKKEKETLANQNEKVIKLFQKC